MAASFQQAVVDVLVDNALRAAEDFHMDKLAIAGGVASNQTLRGAMEKSCRKKAFVSITRRRSCVRTTRL